MNCHKIYEALSLSSDNSRWGSFAENWKAKDAALQLMKIM